jgi:predicted thioesterase
MQKLTTGVRGTREIAVTDENTAKALGSGGLAVFATPAMITLMEFCAANSVLPFLPEGSSTVGTKLDIRHLSATPVGMAVRCEIGAGRNRPPRLVFACKCIRRSGTDRRRHAGRFVVDNAKFMEKNRNERITKIRKRIYPKQQRPCEKMQAVAVSKFQDDQKQCL